MKLDHVLIRTTDLKVMSEFLTEVIGFEPGPRPPFSFPGGWFYSEGQPMVHVAEDSSREADEFGPFGHAAFTGADYDALIGRLEASHWKYRTTEVPGSGNRQVFIHGPDHVLIEMLFPPA